MTNWRHSSVTAEAVDRNPATAQVCYSRAADQDYEEVSNQFSHPSTLIRRRGSEPAVLSDGMRWRRNRARVTLNCARAMRHCALIGLQAIATKRAGHWLPAQFCWLLLWACSQDTGAGYDVERPKRLPNKRMQLAGASILRNVG
jgi:hypothetical protein